jgi:predicted nuclease of predicted toxin-antitoxin system
VKFLVDTQLPKHLCFLLTEMGHDAVHVSDLPNGNRSTDAEVIAAAEDEGRVVVSKDSEFRHSHLLRGEPSRLLAVVTGNVSNIDLLGLFNTNADRILSALDESNSVELGTTSLMVHGEPPIPDQPDGPAE